MPTTTLANETEISKGTITLANYWHPIATIDEVVEQPRSFRLLGDQVVAFRDRDGVAAFRDLCIHRGTALSLGTITDGRLTCAYHGWQYDRTGACVHIPSLPPGSSVPRKARAIVYQAAERYGLVWVAMSEPVAPIPSWPDNAWENPEFHTRLAATYTWNASAGRAIENAMDFSHFNFIHRGYTELADGPVIKQHHVREVEHGLEYSYDDSRIIREYSLRMPFCIHDRKVQRPGSKSDGTWTDAAEVTDKDAVTILTLIGSPTDEKHTRLFNFVSRNHSFHLTDEEFSGQLLTVVEQDRRVVESQRPEQIPTDLRDELHLKVPDATGIAYRTALGRIQGVGPFLP